jgi:hypothetical protein
MRAITRLIVALGFGVALAGAAAADPEQAVVTVAYDGIPKDVFPVAILEVDGTLQPLPRRETLFLAPGKHSFKLMVKVQDGKTLLRGNAHNTRNKDKPGVLELELEAGKRYHLGGKLKGYRTSDWEPVVLRVDDTRD